MSPLASGTKKRKEKKWRHLIFLPWAGGPPSKAVTALPLGIDVFSYSFLKILKDTKMPRVENVLKIYMHRKLQLTVPHVLVWQEEENYSWLILPTSEYLFMAT